MRARRTRTDVLTRLQRLESRAAVAAHQVKLRFGKLRRLPPEYQGERHVVIAKQLPSKGGREWVEYEEVPGPDPNPAQERKLGRPGALRRPGSQCLPTRVEIADSL